MESKAEGVTKMAHSFWQEIDLPTTMKGVAQISVGRRRDVDKRLHWQNGTGATEELEERASHLSSEPAPVTSTCRREQLERNR